jgi:K(+)-stimulated pyrophosphate-energized sodium pump
VGDPFKDTSGPSLNILIKLVSIVAVVIAPLLLNPVIKQKNAASNEIKVSAPAGAPVQDANAKVARFY